MQHRAKQQLLRGPGQRVAKRNARKEKLVKCGFAPRPPPHHPPRDGSIDLTEGPSVPEGKAKSEQAPIRRPPSRGGPLHRSAPKRLSLWTVHGPFLFWQDKREMGGHPRWTSPLAGASTLEAAVRRPLPLPADQLIQRQAVEIRQGNQCGQGRFPQTQLIVLIGAPTDSNFHRKSLLTQVSCCSQLKKMFRKCHGHPLFS